MPGTSEALLAGLDPEQREVAVAARGPVCVLAGAGTGKTRAIAYRIAYAALSGTVDPAHVLALTFTVRAAGELRGRLRQLGVGQVRASTFHAAALRQLNYFWPRVVGGRPPQLIDSKAGLVREAAKRAWSGSTASRGRSPTPPPRSSGPRSSRSARTGTRPPRPPRAVRPRPGRTTWPRSTPPTRTCGGNGT
jgi:Superfamily I DNA and RNA helicases